MSAPFLLTGTSDYHALQVIFVQRPAAGLTMTLNHTWSTTLTDTQGGRSQYLRENDRTLGETDRAHVFNAALVYELPFGESRAWSRRNGVLRALVSDWRVSGITRIRSGLPYRTITGNCDLPSAGTCHADLNPDVSGPVRINGDIGSGDLLGPDPPVFIDRNAFKDPDPFTFGDAPRKNVFGLRNPAFWNQDLSVARQFSLTREVRLVAQVDAFNAFNTGAAGYESSFAGRGRIEVTRQGGMVSAPRTSQSRCERLTSYAETGPGLQRRLTTCEKCRASSISNTACQPTPIRA